MAVRLTKSGLARKRLSSVKLVTCYMVVIISCMPVITNGNMSTMAALAHHHGRHNNHHRETVVDAPQLLQLSNEQTYLNKRQSPYKTSEKRKHQKFSTALVDDETETESVWDDTPVTPPWSHRKLVPATTTHHKSELDSKLRTLRPLRPSKSDATRISDYQSDVDFKDYESEDPRAHIGLAEHQSQLEKSLLEKEHTSTRPDNSHHHSPHHSPHHSDHHPELKCVLIDQQTKFFTHSAHSLLTKPESHVEPRNSKDDTLSDSPKVSGASHRKAPQPQRKQDTNLPYTNFQSFSQCPTCYAHYLNHEKTFVENSDTKNKIDSESIRLEAIKQQILNKLGLKHRPIIKKKLPREIVLQSLYRAEEDNIDFFNDENSRYLKKITAERNSESNDKIDEISEPASGEEAGGAYSTNEVQDDFYARTSEIIVFGDAGAKLNNQQLVEFSLAKYSDTGDQELKVKAAMLWVKVSFHPLLTHAKKRLVTHRNVTLWVFRLVQDHINNRISSQEFDKYMAMATSLTVNLASLGWQKFDLTSTVRDWYQNVLKPQTTTEPTSYKEREDSVEPESNLTHFRKPNPNQRDISRLNYESVEFGNYHNRANQKADKESESGTNKEYDYDSDNDDQTAVAKKLRLLIDCSGCKDLVQIHLFNLKSESSEKKPSRKKLKKNRDYEFYTYDGYFNVRASSEFQDDLASRNKTRKKLDMDDLGNGTSHKSGDNVEHRHSNHERNFHHNDSSTPSINLQNSDSSSSLDPSEMYESSDSDNDDPNRPFLVIHTDPNIMKRVRRRALDCSGALKGQCCKQRFYVNFTDLGWSDWILAPQGYYANYCMGSCNSVHRTPDTFLNYYTHVIHEYQKYGDLKGLQPCCAPVKFSSTSLIYFGPDSNIIKRDLPKMTVDECGCP